MVAPVADRASQRPKTVTSQRVFRAQPPPVCAAGLPSTFKEIPRPYVHRSHHPQLEHQPAHHDPAGQLPHHEHRPPARGPAARHAATNVSRSARATLVSPASNALRHWLLRRESVLRIVIAEQSPLSQLLYDSGVVQRLIGRQAG